MTVTEAIMLAQLVERGVTSAMQLRAMRESGISDDQIRAYLAELDRVHQAHQDLDLRAPGWTPGDPAEE